VQLYLRHGFDDPDEILSRIQGADLDAPALTVAAVRLGLFMSAATGAAYTQLAGRIELQFRNRDSLEHFTEQESLRESYNSGFSSAHIVVGNPPYVRADKLPKEVKAKLRLAYPSIAGGSVDLYNYFIGHGLMALRSRGVLCYVTPASFQRSVYGQKTRDFIRRTGAVRAVFDFDELPVFESVGVHPSVFVIARDDRQNEVHAVSFESLLTPDPLLQGLKTSTIINVPSGGDPWRRTGSAVGVLPNTNRSSFVSLADYVGEIYSGVKTGCKQAYFVDGELSERLRNRDLSVDRFLKPMLRPAHIRAWRYQWDGSHMIVATRGAALPPVLLAHLAQYREQLRRRADLDKGTPWYSLRACTYYDIFHRPKIVFPDIASTCRFAIDELGFVLPDGAFMLPTGSYYLLGLLNSYFGEQYFRAYCTSIGNPYRRGRLRFKKAYVRNFPVRVPDAATQSLVNEIAAVAHSLSQIPETEGLKIQLDRLVLRLYAESGTGHRS
jgi:hypothetical protein